MGMQSVRLSSTITFDEFQEADIIKLINDFSSSHKMGDFLSNLIRVAVDNPELLENKNGTHVEGNLIKLVERIGKSPARSNYMNEINKKVADMQAKVDQTYEMCLKLMTMVEMGKRLGLEQKTQNMILAQFAVEQQMEQLKQTTGVDYAKVPFAANRLATVEDRAGKILDFILSAYEPVINELQKELTIEPLKIPVETLSISGVVAQPSLSVNTGSEGTNGQVESTKSSLNLTPTEFYTEEADNEDFNDTADFDAIANFFGD